MRSIARVIFDWKCGSQWVGSGSPNKPRSQNTFGGKHVCVAHSLRECTQRVGHPSMGLRKRWSAGNSSRSWVSGEKIESQEPSSWDEMGMRQEFVKATGRRQVDKGIVRLWGPGFLTVRDEGQEEGRAGGSGFLNSCGDKGQGFGSESWGTRPPYRLVSSREARL